MLTNEQKRDTAHSHSGVCVVTDHGHVVIGVRIVQCYHAIMDNSEHVVISVRIVQCYHAIMDNSEHVVIGVRIVQCYHAIMSNSDFSTFGPNFILVPSSTCSQFQLVVRLY